MRVSETRRYYRPIMDVVSSLRSIADVTKAWRNNSSARGTPTNGRFFPSPCITISIKVELFQRQLFLHSSWFTNLCRSMIGYAFEFVRSGTTNTEISSTLPRTLHQNLFRAKLFIEFVVRMFSCRKLMYKSNIDQGSR